MSFCSQEHGFPGKAGCSLSTHCEIVTLSLTSREDVAVILTEIGHLGRGLGAPEASAAGSLGGAGDLGLGPSSRLASGFPFPCDAEELVLFKICD